MEEGVGVVGAISESCDCEYEMTVNFVGLNGVILKDFAVTSSKKTREIKQCDQKSKEMTRNLLVKVLFR